jgi:hypothetical protein
MPFVFIHGVNTRTSDDDYQKNIAARNKLIRVRLLDPLARSDKRFTNMRILNPYWGDDGARFRWGLASVPDVSVVEHMGVDEGGTLDADFELAETVSELTGPPTPAAADMLESYGSDDAPLRRGAEADLTRFTEAVLTPLLTSERRLCDPTAVTDTEEGEMQALVAVAAEDVSTGATLRQAVSAASSDDELMELLAEKVTERLEELLAGEPGQNQSAAGDNDMVSTELEAYGSKFNNVRDSIHEVFDRMKGAPARASTIPALKLFRERSHRRLIRFLGDIFVYLNDREPIVSKAVVEIQQAVTEAPDSPLIVMTHSMGGNIFYDILSWYAPDIRPDLWVSVGGQVGQFEEMKLFKASDPTVGAPQMVDGLKPRLGYWLNVYDPADVLSFKTAPVFADVDADVPYLTGSGALGAHGAYFGRSSFYSLVRMHVTKAMS